MKLTLMNHNTIKRCYQKISPNFDPELDKYLHDIIKKSSIKGILVNAETNLKSYCKSETALSINKSYFRSKLLNPSTCDPNQDILVIFALGDYIYRNIIAEFGKEKMYTNDIAVEPNGSNWKFSMRSLSSVNLKEGMKVYYSLNSNKVNINGELYQIAYTEHCIERIIQRVKRSKYDYASLGDVFSFLYENQYFEKATLSDQSDAYSIYGMCNEEGFSQFQIVNAIYGNKYIPGEKYYFQIGYLPIKIFGKFAVAQTLLCPGFCKTPEYEQLQKSELNSEWLKRAQENERNDSLTTYDLPLIKIMHELGIPQVRIFKEHLYRFKRDTNHVVNR